MIGLLLGLAFSFFYYSWAKKEAFIHFQGNIGKSKFLAELGKWQEKNLLQAREMMTKAWRELGIYEELKSETNPEVINKRVMARIEELTDDEKKEYNKKAMEAYQEYAPSFLEKLEEGFPWYLRYSRIIFFSIILASSGFGFGLGYLLEPEKDKDYY